MKAGWNFLVGNVKLGDFSVDVKIFLQIFCDEIEIFRVSDAFPAKFRSFAEKYGATRGVLDWPVAWKFRNRRGIGRWFAIPGQFL